MFGGGAECSTARNPLAQFNKHTQEDRSLQRPGMQHQSSQQSMREEHRMNQMDQQVCASFGYASVCFVLTREHHINSV